MKYLDFQGLPNNAVADQGPLTVSSSAVTLASLLSGGVFHDKTTFVRVRFEMAVLRVSTNGATTPTATLGREYQPGDEVLLSRSEAENCKLIASGSDGRVQVSQYIN